MKKLLLFLAFLLNYVFAQQPSFEWVKKIGGIESWDEGYALTIDGDGNILVTGCFMGTVDFDPGPGIFNLTAGGYNDIFISKFDSNGNFVWAKRVGEIGNNIGYTIATDDLGNVYTAGYFTLTADLDPGPSVFNLSSSLGTDMFILKLDPNGDFIWAKQLGGSSSSICFSMEFDNNGDLYTTGYFTGTVDFDPGPGSSNLTSAGGADIFVAKYDNDGNYIWAKRIGNTQSDIGESIALDSSGGIYITGYFEGSVDFDPSGFSSVFLSSAGGSQDIFVLKLNSDGNYCWAKRIGNTNNDAGSSIETDDLGSIYITGHFAGTVDFDPNGGIYNLTGMGSQDIFISKLDTAGNFIWANGFGDSGWDMGMSVDVDSSGNVYSTGSFLGTIDFDPGLDIFNLTANAQKDIFISKLDPNGDFVWAFSMGGAENDQGRSISLDLSNNVYTTGQFFDVVDFDPGIDVFELISEGGGDIFLHKLNQCPPSFSIENISACDSLQWVNGITYFSDTTDSFVIPNASSTGCDSIVTLNLTILNSNTSVESVTSCSTYIWPANGNTYNSTGTYTTTITNVAGCDSVVTLNLTINTVSDVSTAVSGITITANNTNASYIWLDCDNGYTIIPGETNQSYTPSANGNYAVELSENGCTDTSACVVITSVGIIENTFNEAFTIHPNPTSGLFSIEFNSSQAYIKLNIMDASGKLIGTKNYDHVTLIEYELNQPKGVYLIEVFDGESQRSLIRLLKQ